MKKTYYAIAGAFAALAVLLLAAAVPSQTDFDATYFQTNTLPISLRGNLTNWSKLETNVITSGGGGTVGTVINTGASTARAVPVFSGTDGTNTVPSGATIDASNNLLVGDGTAGAPSLGFTSDNDGTGAGFYRRGANEIGMTANGVARARLSTSALSFASTMLLGWESGAIPTTVDTILLRDGAANTLALRNGANEQTFSVYNSYTDSANYGRLRIASSGNIYFIQSEKQGTGAVRPIQISAGTSAINLDADSNISLRNAAGTVRWRVDTSGHFIAGADNTYDIGASGATRPRNVYVAGTVTATAFSGGPTLFLDTSGLSVESGDFIKFGTRSRLTSAADGTVQAQNNAGTALAAIDANYNFSATLATDDTYQGNHITGLQNSGGVTQWDAVYLNGSSQWVLADANGSGTFPCRGLASATVATATATTIVTSGTVRNDAWNWTPGGTVYLSTTAGGLTQTAPATTGDTVQVIGFALTADIIMLQISPDIGTAP